LLYSIIKSDLLLHQAVDFFDMVNKKLLKKLKRLCGKENVLYHKQDLYLYHYDASMETGYPDAVVFPRSRDEIQALVSLLSDAGVPYIPRGSATNLAGGTVAPEGGIIIELSRMNRILEIDIPNQVAVVEPGVYNLDLQNALAPYGYFFAPDPASQKVSTLGGNVAMNAGGPHCLKYGVTVNHVLGAEMVLPNGELLQVGGKAGQAPGFDLLGIINGSEGTLGIVTRLFLKILPSPESVLTMLVSFPGIEAAATAVSTIIANGIVPATLEYMDNQCIQAVLASMSVDYPPDAAAILIIETDGPSATLKAQAQTLERICREHQASDVRIAKDQKERDSLWAGRRGALGAMTRLKPSVVVFDGTVPRNRLPEALEKIDRICKKYNLRYGTLLHAGDGNIHPIIVYDERDREESERVYRGCDEIMRLCVDLGGTITGEHGIGTEKIPAMNYLFSQQDMQAMFKIKNLFDPSHLCNPGKVFPANFYHTPENKN